MLKPLSAGDARQLRQFLAAEQYTQEELQRRAILPELPKSMAGNLPHLLEEVRDPTTLNLLLRWFFLGVPAPGDLPSGMPPEPILKILVDSGMLIPEKSGLMPAVMLTPRNQYLFASDTAACLDAPSPEMIVWPNPTSRLLYQFTIRRPVESTLDLGAGCGIQALMAAGHSGQVTGTDLNPRAAEFTGFNAWLNGIDNIECLTGDTFATVQNRTFDLILSNPPFFVTPSSGQIHCESDMELDGYCRRVVREAPRHLNEGGFLQMVLEWVQVRGQDWRDRLREWLAGSGCDAWILRGYTREAGAYARERIMQTGAMQNDPAALSRWLTYYRERRVEEIHGGRLALRRRAGSNWVRIEEMPLDPGGPIGEAVWQAFAGMDFLDRHRTDETMLAARPRLSPDVQLEQQMRQVNGRWQSVGMTLRFIAGVPANTRLEPPVADFLAGLDGHHTLGELAGALSKRVNADLRTVERECVAVVRMLMERRFLLP